METAGLKTIETAINAGVTGIAVLLIILAVALVALFALFLFRIYAPFLQRLSETQQQLSAVVKANSDNHNQIMSLLDESRQERQDLHKAVSDATEATNKRTEAAREQADALKRQADALKDQSQRIADLADHFKDNIDLNRQIIEHIVAFTKDNTAALASYTQAVIDRTTALAQAMMEKLGAQHGETITAIQAVPLQVWAAEQGLEYVSSVNQIHLRLEEIGKSLSALHREKSENEQILAVIRDFIALRDDIKRALAVRGDKPGEGGSASA